MGFVFLKRLRSNLRPIQHPHTEPMATIAASHTRCQQATELNPLCQDLRIDDKWKKEALFQGQHLNEGVTKTRCKLSLLADWQFRTLFPLLLAGSPLCPVGLAEAGRGQSLSPSARGLACPARVGICILSRLPGGLAPFMGCLGLIRTQV